MKKIFLSLFVVTALCFNACKKGEDGIDGAKGEKGDKGDVGAQGAKGADGTMIHNGTGAPATTVGNIGDYYLDKTTSNLYGPKTATGWPTPMSLKGDAGATGATGATGAAGAAGTKILSGTTAPALALGSAGDFYFDTANLAIYGPKTATSWGNAISLKAGSGVTTFMYNNVALDNVTLDEVTVDSYYQLNVYSYSAKKIVNISHPVYADAYERGMVIVRFRISGDPNSFWSYHIYSEKGNWVNGRGDSFYIGSDDDKFIEPARVVIPADLYTTEDPNGNFLKNTRLDVKVVCIPSGTVVQMATQRVDVKDATAVAKYLNL